jgi:hypothetical protein
MNSVALNNLQVEASFLPITHSTARGCLLTKFALFLLHSLEHCFLISLRDDCRDQVSRGGLNPTIRVRKIAQSRSRHSLKLQTALIDKPLQTKMADE